MPGLPTPRIAARALAAAWVVIATTEVNVVEVPPVPPQTAEVRLFLFSGSASDPDGKEGVAALTARLALPEPAVPGATVLIDRHFTIIRYPLPETGVEEAFDRLALSLLDPARGPERLDREKEALRRSLDARRADPERLAEEAFDAFVYRGHRWSHPPEGSEASRGAIGPDDIAAFHAAHYRKGNLVVGLTPEVRARLGAGAAEALAALPDGAAPSEESPQPSYLARPRGLLLEVPSARETRVIIGHPLGTSPAHPDHLALRAALATLPGTDGAAALSSDGLPLPRSRDRLALHVTAPPEEAASRAARMIDSLGDLVDRGPEEAALREVQGQWLAHVAPAPAAPSGPTREIWRLFQRSPAFDERWAASVRALTTTKVHDAVRRHIFPGRLAICVVAPGAEPFLRAWSEAGGRMAAAHFETATPEELLP